MFDEINDYLAELLNADRYRSRAWFCAFVLGFGPLRRALDRHSSKRIRMHGVHRSDLLHTPCSQFSLVFEKKKKIKREVNGDYETIKKDKFHSYLQSRLVFAPPEHMPRITSFIF